MMKIRQNLVAGTRQQKLKKKQTDVVATYGVLSLLHEKFLQLITVAQVVKKSSTFYGSWKWIPTFATCRNWTMVCITWIHSLLYIPWLQISF